MARSRSLFATPIQPLSSQLFSREHSAWTRDFEDVFITICVDVPSMLIRSRTARSSPAYVVFSVSGRRKFILRSSPCPYQTPAPTCALSAPSFIQAPLIHAVDMSELLSDSIAALLSYLVGPVGP